MTPEGKVKEKVKKILKAYNIYYYMPVQNGMGMPTLDFIGCYKEYFFAIETKAPGKIPTPRQQNTIATMIDAGARVFIIDGGCADLLRWLENPR